MTTILRLYEVFNSQVAYCVVCFRTETERRMLSLKLVKMFLRSTDVPFTYDKPNQKLCWVCEQQVRTALRVRLALSLSASLHLLYKHMSQSCSNYANMTKQLLGRQPKSKYTKSATEWTARLNKVRAQTFLSTTEMLVFDVSPQDSQPNKLVFPRNDVASTSAPMSVLGPHVNSSTVGYIIPILGATLGAQATRVPGVPVGAKMITIPGVSGTQVTPVPGVSGTQVTPIPGIPRVQGVPGPGMSGAHTVSILDAQAQIETAAIPDALSRVSAEEYLLPDDPPSSVYKQEPNLLMDPVVIEDVEPEIKKETEPDPPRDDQVNSSPEQSLVHVKKLPNQNGVSKDVWMLHPIVGCTGIFTVPTLGVQIKDGMLITMDTNTILSTPKLAVGSGDNIYFILQPSDVIAYLKSLPRPEDDQCCIVSERLPIEVMEENIKIVTSRLNYLAQIAKHAIKANEISDDTQCSAEEVSQNSEKKIAQSNVVEEIYRNDDETKTKEKDGCDQRSQQSGTDWEDKIPMDVISFLDTKEASKVRASGASMAVITNVMSMSDTSTQTCINRKRNVICNDSTIRESEDELGYKVSSAPRDKIGPPDTGGAKTQSNKKARRDISSETNTIDDVIDLC